MTHEEILAQYGPREAMEYDIVIVGGAIVAVLFSLFKVPMKRDGAVDEAEPVDEVAAK